MEDFDLVYLGQRFRIRYERFTVTDGICEYQRHKILYKNLCFQEKSLEKALMKLKKSLDRILIS